jgi:hypothetical protein
MEKEKGYPYLPRSLNAMQCARKHFDGMVQECLRSLRRLRPLRVRGSGSAKQVMWDRSLKGKCGPSDVLVARANDLSPAQGETAVMDDLDRLRESPDLCVLLDHYIELGNANHDTWQDRVMEMSELDAKEITKLHAMPRCTACRWRLSSSRTGASSSDRRVLEKAAGTSDIDLLLRLYLRRSRTMLFSSRSLGCQLRLLLEQTLVVEPITEPLDPLVGRQVLLLHTKSVPPFGI